MRKWISLTAALLLTLMLAACGGAGEGGSSAAGESAVASGLSSVPDASASGDTAAGDG